MSIAEPPGTPDASADAEPVTRTVETPDVTGGADAAPGRVPVLDVVRDVVAAVALLTCLALPWTIRSAGAGRVEVVLSVVVALAAIPLPYLARAGVLPTGWSVHTTRAVRLWAATPYVVVAVVYLLLDLVAGSGLDRGVGTGLGLGLAGALLVAQPRSSELGPDDEDAAVGRLWRLVLGVLGAVLVVGAVVALVIFLSSDRWSGAAQLFYAVCGALVVLAVGALPAWGAFRGDRSWSTVVVGVGAALAVLFVIGAGSAPDLLRLESFHTLRFGLVLVPALGAVAAGAAFRRGLSAAPDDAGSARAASDVVRDTLLLVAVVAALIAIEHAVVLADGVHGVRATSVVVTLVASGAVAVLAALAWAAGRREDAAGRGLAWLVVGTAIVLGTVAVSVDSWKVVGVPVELALVAYGLPVLLVLALLGPSVRAWGSGTRVAVAGPRTAYEWTPRPHRAPRPAAARRAAVPARSGEEGGPGAAPVVTDGPSSDGARPAPFDAEPIVPEPIVPEPVAPEPVAPEPVVPEPAPSGTGHAARPREQADVEPAGSFGEAAEQPDRAVADAQSTTVLPVAGYTAEQAADPRTPLEVLAQIAEHAPGLRPYVASNPSTYTALLDWLGALGDPAVDAALQARPDRRG